MSDINTPENYLAFNEEGSKNPVIVLKIIGAPDVLTNRTLKTRVLYGDPDVFYGQSGLVYGGLRDFSIKNADGTIGSFRDYLDLDASNMVLQQRLEPEQGRASVSTLSLAFIDKNGYMTNLVSPGFVLDEILLAECEVYLGFSQISYPQDFFRLFRGYISSVDDAAGNVVLQISDANIRLRTTLFFTANTGLSANITATDLLIQVDSNADFYQQITQPNGSAYNLSIKNYIQIDDEWIQAEPLFQANEGYTAYIQGITYTAGSGLGSAVSIQYITGGNAGSEVITVVGTQITIKIQSGVSTAAQIATAIQRNEDASTLVSTAVYHPAIATTQTVQAQTFLSLNTNKLINIQGIVYFQAAVASGVTITYANTATAGSETVTVASSAITIHMQTGVSTAAQIATALKNAIAMVSPLVTFTVLPFAETIVQVAQASTAMVVTTPGTMFAVVQRGARGTTADVHTVSGDPNNPTTVAAGIQVGDLVNAENALDMALKLMLSGWGGNWVSDVALASINITPDPLPFQSTSNILQFPSGVDVVNDYGLVAGDIITIYNSPNGATNGVPAKIVRFADYESQSNRLVYLDTFFAKEPTTVATASFRSQYDQYPINAGLMLTPKDVDVAGHTYVKQTFLGAGGNNLMFFIIAQEDSGKDFVQTEVYYPIGAFGLTRYGKLSCGYNAPPIANQNVVTLDETDILSPDKIKVSRAANNRTLFNEIDFTYAPLDDGSTFTKVINVTSAPSLNALKGFTNPLPITSRGLYASYPANLIEKYALFLLNKYAFSVTQIPLTVNWRAGSVIEVGDVCILDDSKGILQIANFQTGQRGLGKQLYNIINRTFNIKDATIDLTLQGGLNATVTDRFATISPSSKVDVGSTTTQIIIKDSYGAIFPGNESKKWANYVGLPITVHSSDYTQTADVTLVSIDPVNNYALNVTTIPFVPAENYVVDIQNYPNNPDPTVNALYKLMHAFLSPLVLVVTGIDQRNLTVSGGDIAKFFVGSIIRVHSVDYSVDSGDVTVTIISGTTITVDNALGFVPTVGLQINLIGFSDKGQSYRFI